MIVKKVVSNEALFISDNDDSLFYRVPRNILSAVDGCPSNLTNIEISFDDESERVIILIPGQEHVDTRFTLYIQIEKIMKAIENECLPKDEFDGALFAIRTR